MSKFPLDLSKFRKVSTDKDKSVLRHYEGHELTIAHNKLSSKLKSQLDNIPMASKKTQKFDDGGPVQPDQNSTPLPSEADQIVDDAANVSPGGASADGSSSPPSSGQIPAAAQATSPELNKPGTGYTTPVAGPGDPYGSISSLNGQVGALQEEKQGQQMVEQAKGNLGKNQAVQENAYQNDLQNKYNTYTQATDEVNGERKSLQDDIANFHVDPRHYVDKVMTTGGKIRSAIGLILGGMGSGLTGGPNLAFNYLQNQINQDIDAQKSELGKKQNLLSHNLQTTQNLRAAMDLTRIQLNDMLNSHIRQEADKSANPIAQGTKEFLSGQFNNESAKLTHNIAIEKMRMGDTGGMDPAKMVPVLVPPEHQKQAFSEIEAAENTRNMSDSIMKAFDDAAHDNTVLRTGAGLLRTPGSVYALQQAMQPTFKDLEGTVRQAAMENTFKNTTPEPGDTDSKVATRRQSLQDYLKSKMSAPTARAYGIDLAKYHSTAPNQTQAQPIRRIDPKSGKVALFDQNKKFLGYE